LIFPTGEGVTLFYYYLYIFPFFVTEKTGHWQSVTKEPNKTLLSIRVLRERQPVVQSLMKVLVYVPAGFVHRLFQPTISTDAFPETKG